MKQDNIYIVSGERRDDAIVHEYREKETDALVGFTALVPRRGNVAVMDNRLIGVFDSPWEANMAMHNAGMAREGGE